MTCNMFITMNNGLKMPAFGYGTWQATENELKPALNEALKVGYRHIDTAAIYQNEKAIGVVLKQWLDLGKVTREELFITTKLLPVNSPSMVEASLRNSLSDLQLSYLDLYLIHVPFSIVFENGALKQNENGEIVIDSSTDLVALWRKMEEMVKKGLTKSIGISNFNINQIQRVIENSTIIPANLQIEHHIYLQQKELLDFCKANGISVTAYSPLGSKGIANLNTALGINRELPNLMDCAEVKELAEKHGKTSAQILLRWIIERGICAIPKSTNLDRLKENFDVFDFSLTDEEVNKLCELDCDCRICDFSFFPGCQKHPEFPF